jgi:hypothetical protein
MIRKDTKRQPQGFINVAQGFGLRRDWSLANGSLPRIQDCGFTVMVRLGPPRFLHVITITDKFLAGVGKTILM